MNIETKPTRLDRSEPLSEATSVEEVAELVVLYDYFAHVMLDPLEVPGTAGILALHKRTALLLANVEDNALPGVNQLIAWLKRMDTLVLCENHSSEDIAEEQKNLAIERTKLCRGINQAGPLPPYETYYCTSSCSKADATNVQEGPDTVAGSVTSAYAKAGVHLHTQTKERDDYIGTELAFLSFLAAEELKALERGEHDAAIDLQTQRQSFERYHLRSWVPAFCEAALPFAHTTLFQGALHALKSIAA